MTDALPLQPRDLARYIADHGIQAQLVSMQMETATVAHAAEALGVEADQIVKTLVFSVRDETFLVIAPGTRTVERRALADRFGVGKKQVKLADKDTVLAKTGYAAGGVPPIGHLLPVLVLIDRAIARWNEVYGGGGDDRTLLRIAPCEVARITRGVWIDLGPPDEA